MKLTLYLSIAFLISISVTSCLYQSLYNTVIVEKDDFKKRTRVFINFQQYAQSLKTNDIFYRRSISTYLSFQSYQEDTVFSPVKFFLSIDVMPETDLNNEFFIKTDSELYELNFDDIRNREYIRKNESNTTTTNVTTTVKENNSNSFVNTDNTLISNTCSKPKTQETTTETKIVNSRNVSEYTRKKIRGQALLNYDVSRDILYSNNLTIRYYLNDTPYTMEFNYFKLKKLKEFLIHTIYEKP